MPDVTGMRVTEALDYCSSTGAFDKENIDSYVIIDASTGESVSEISEEMLVISQEPEAGKKISLIGDTANVAEKLILHVSTVGGADGPTSIFMAGDQEKISNEPGSDDLVVTQTRHFYNYKTDSAEDAVNIANICFEEVLNGHFPMSDFSQSIESFIGGERLIMTFDEPLDASENWEDHFSKVGNMLLALVDQLQGIRFEYQIEGREDELITLEWDIYAANESLLEGDIKAYGSTREKIDQLMEEMGYDPYQAEIIGMDRFGIRLSTKNVSPTGLTLVCVQDGTETTGQLQTREKYKLVVQNGDTWEDVDYATDAIVWEDIALLIPNNGEVEWDIDWTRIYGELPEGKYCIVKEINDFRTAGDYDTQVYSVAFEIGK